MRIATWVAAVIAATWAASAAPAQQLTFDDVVRKLEASVEPKSVKPGGKFTWRLTIDLVDDWHTYPTRQSSPEQAGFVTKITFPKIEGLTFSGAFKEPKPIVKKDPDGDIAMLEGLIVIENQVSVAADAKPGKITLKVPVKVQVCNKETCLPPKTVMLEASVTVAEK